MREHRKPQGFARQAGNPNEQGGNTISTTSEQASEQPEQLGEQAFDLAAALATAIADDTTHTASALAEQNQVSSATIRTRWAETIAEAILPYSLRAKDGKYTAIAAFAFGLYRETVAIDRCDKAQFIAMVQDALPVSQPSLVQDAPGGLSIRPWFSPGSIDASQAENQAEDLEAIVAEVVWQIASAEASEEDQERRQRLAEVARKAANDFVEEEQVYSAVKSRLVAEKRTAKKQARSPVASVR